MTTLAPSAKTVLVADDTAFVHDRFKRARRRLPILIFSGTMTNAEAVRDLAARVVLDIPVAYRFGNTIAAAAARASWWLVALGGR